MSNHSPARVAYRYLSGRPLSGVRPTGGYLRRGTHGDYFTPWGRAPGWQRQAWRLGAPAVAVAGYAGFTTHPKLAAAAAALIGWRVGRHVRRWWRLRRFRRTYIRPTMGALRPALGDAPFRLHADPELGQLMARLARPMSPAERAVRAWYGQRVEPATRWLPDRVQRAGWAVQRAASPATRRLDLFRAPRTDPGQRIELTASVPYLTDEQRNFIQAVIEAKLPAGEMTKTWDQVGPRARVTWTVRRRPPTGVGFADFTARFDRLAEWEFFLGLGVGSKPVTVDLKDDSPHIALSAGSGAGKSVLAQLMAVQVLARGGQVAILDRKGSHRWALGMPGVDYCTRPEQMHNALLRLSALADDRNDAALHEEEGWDPGPRVLVIAEELNATMAQLRAWWAQARQQGDPKIPPAVTAFRNLLFMGRSAKINVLAVAQMLTALTTGGPESRENFGVRALARYTRNNWQMLVPEAHMPRPSRTLGRWQVVVRGQATETQVAYLTAAQARLVVTKHRGVLSGEHVSTREDSPLVRDLPGMSQRIETEPDPMAVLISLRDAVDRGAVPWRYHAARQRLQRGRKAGRAVPEPRSSEGRKELYRLGDLISWAEQESTTTAMEHP